MMNVAIAFKQVEKYLKLEEKEKNGNKHRHTILIVSLCVCPCKICAHIEKKAGRK